MLEGQCIRLASTGPALSICVLVASCHCYYVHVPQINANTMSFTLGAPSNIPHAVAAAADVASHGSAAAAAAAAAAAVVPAAVAARDRSPAADVGTGSAGVGGSHRVTAPAGTGAGERAAASSAADTAAAAAGARLSAAAGANGAFAVTAAALGCLNPAAPQPPAAATVTREAAEEERSGPHQLQARRSTSRVKPLQQSGNQHTSTMLPSGKGFQLRSSRLLGNKVEKSLPLDFALECFEPPITGSKEVQIQVLVQGNDLSKLPAAVAVQDLLGEDRDGGHGAVGASTQEQEGYVSVMETRGKLRVTIRSQKKGKQQLRIRVQPELLQFQDWRMHKVESVSLGCGSSGDGAGWVSIRSLWN